MNFPQSNAPNSNSVGNWRYTCRYRFLKFLDCGSGKIIASVVKFVVGMPFDFHVGHFVNLHKGEKFLPQIDVFHFVLARRAPTFHNPTVYPTFEKRLDRIRAVAVNCDDARLFEHFKPLYDGGQLHTVVGGVLLRAAGLFFMSLVEHNDAPTADTGIAGASSVSIDFNFLFHDFIVHKKAAICNTNVRLRKS